MIGSGISFLPKTDPLFYLAKTIGAIMFFCWVTCLNCFFSLANLGEVHVSSASHFTSCLQKSGFLFKSFTVSSKGKQDVTYMHKLKFFFSFHVVNNLFLIVLRKLKGARVILFYIVHSNAKQLCKCENLIGITSPMFLQGENRSRAELSGARLIQT